MQPESLALFLSQEKRHARRLNTEPFRNELRRNTAKAAASLWAVFLGNEAYSLKGNAWKFYLKNISHMTLSRRLS